MGNIWPTKKLGDKEYFEILGSGMEKFEGEKEYLSTSSIERNKIIAPECKITYQKRPSRANMQPRLNSVWFAKMINTIKVYSFTEANKDEIDKYILSTGFAGILCNTEKVNPRYLEKIFLSKWFNDLKDSLASDKAIQKSLNNEDIADLEIPLPPLPIQQKIVKILDTVQSAVEIQDKIIEKTKELKKSLMAELFKFGGPSFRKGRKLKKTEIGEIPEDWEVVRLGDVFKIVAGGDISKLNFSSTKTDKFIYPIYSNTIANNGLYGFADTYQFEGNCITVTARGTIGYAIPRFEKFNAIIRLLVLIPKINLNIIFVSEFINEKIRVAFENTSIPQLTVPRFSIFKIPLPPLPEQQEIAEILQTIDQKIEIEQKKKELYEELFKTLLNKIMNQEIDVDSLDLSELEN